MGGIAIVGSVVLGYAIGHIGTEIRFSRTGYLAIGAVVAFGLIGYLDDYIKVRHRRSLGLNKRGKSAAQLVCALVFAELAVHWAHTSTALSFTRSGRHRHQPGPGRLGRLRRAGDGRARRTRSTSPTAWTAWPPGRERSASPCSPSWATGSSGTSRIYHVLPASAIDLALVSVALAGACIGFLWWNAAPGQDHHGRHGIAGHRRRPRRALPAPEPGPAAARHRRALRHGDRLGDPPDHQLPGRSIGASSAWRRSITTSSWAAGPRRR